MKTKIIFFLLLTYAGTGVSNAQVFDISAGLKSVKTVKGIVSFIYQDESPVPDIIETYLDLKGNKQAINLAVDYEHTRGKKQFYWLGRLQGYLGEVVGADIGLGGAYPLALNKNNTLSLHPELMVIFGFNKLDMGFLDVRAAGSVYIQVNSTRYNDYESVAIELRNTYLTIRPGVKIVNKITDKISIRGFAGYHLGKGSSEVIFTGNDRNGEQAEEVEKLGQRNLYFDVNGQSKTETPFRARGVELRVGVGISI